MNPRAIRFVIASAVLFCAVQAALAGLVMQFEHTSQPGKPATSGSVYAETDRLRTELGTSVMIFRADKDLLWILDEKNARCTEMSREQMKALAEQARAAMAQMQEQMKSLPEEQRRAMQAMLDSMRNSQKPKVDRTVVDGEILPYCGGIQVIHVPGHTPGHLCLYLVPFKTLVTGDALFVENGNLVPAPPFFNADTPMALASLKKLTRYDIETVISYHGGLYRDAPNRRIAEIAFAKG